LRRTVKEGGLSMNQEKINDSETIINANNLINKKYLIFRKGKKNYFKLKVIP